MVSVEDDSARLDSFMRSQHIANKGFAPNAERQDVINTELRGANIEMSKRMDGLEARTAKLEEEDVERVGAESPEIKGLQDQVTTALQNIREFEGMLAARGSELTHSSSEFAKLGRSIVGNKV